MENHTKTVKITQKFYDNGTVLLIDQILKNFAIS